MQGFATLVMFAMLGLAIPAVSAMLGHSTAAVLSTPADSIEEGNSSLARSKMADSTAAVNSKSPRHKPEPQ